MLNVFDKVVNDWRRRQLRVSSRRFLDLQRSHVLIILHLIRLWCLAVMKQVFDHLVQGRAVHRFVVLIMAFLLKLLRAAVVSSFAPRLLSNGGWSCLSRSLAIGIAGLLSYTPLLRVQMALVLGVLAAEPIDFLIELLGRDAVAEAATELIDFSPGI